MGKQRAHGPNVVERYKALQSWCHERVYFSKGGSIPITANPLDRKEVEVLSALELGPFGKSGT